MEAHRHSYTGAGTVRTSAPGTIFTLDGHPVQDGDSSDGAREFLITRVVHLMHNNLSADMQSAVEKNIGVSALLELMIAEQSGLHAVGADKGERPVYRNRIYAIKAHNPFRAARTDAQGRLLYPRPVMSGQQTAIVVGPAGAPIYTDRDHRVKVQFHWQRDAGGGTAHSRLAHPHPDGQAGAAADDTAGTWVRVAVNLAPVAGANWGGNAIPRVGQEVLVDFMEGDIDRPVVIGALYNGRGETDGQSNLIGHGAGAATGNAPTWFAGEKDAHAHPAVLSGLKGQSLDASQGGAGAYSQLVFDDSPGQSRVSLQHYTKPHAGTSELNLGHLRHQGDNQLLDTTGFGVELKTDNSVALRAGKGLLITTDGRARASSSQLDAGEAQSQIVESHALQESLATAAQSHNATIKESSGEAAPTPKNLPAIAALGGSGKAIESADEGGSAGDPAAGGQGKATAFAQPQLQLSSPHGIVAATPASVSIAAGDTSSLTAGQDINFASQGNHFNIVGNGISLFTLGNVSNHRAGDETGIKLHAATGKVSSQSQSGETKITADKAITVSSVTKSVSVAAKQHVLLASQGAYLKLEGGNIMLHGPGKIEFKASKKDLAGPASSSPTLPQMPQSSDLKNYIELNYRWDDMQPMVGAPYKILFDTGTSIEGKLDANGFARIENTPSVGAVVTFGEDERDAIIRHKRPANVVYGAVPKSEEEADAILAAYLAQEEAYYEDNYFPDEIEAMVNGDDFGEESVLEYDFHYDDYRYEDEDSPEDHAAEQSYRDIHGPAGEEP